MPECCFDPVNHTRVRIQKCAICGGLIIDALPLSAHDLTKPDLPEIGPTAHTADHHDHPTHTTHATHDPDPKRRR